MLLGPFRRSPIRLGGAVGFTLIELLVVMAVVSLLIAIAMPRFSDALDRSKETALRENLRVIRVTLDQFFADKGRYPETLDELVDLRYLRAVPVDPVTESDRTWLTVPPKDGERRGVADVKSGASGSTRKGQTFGTL